MHGRGAPKALIVWGGWQIHEPQGAAELFGREMQARGFNVEISNSLDALVDPENLASHDLVVPIWTMGTITDAQLAALLGAVESGVGLAGFHGGMCDAFRGSPDYQFMTGGQWVAHPGGDGVSHVVHITDTSHPITAGVGDFTVTTEQYYMHVDPANKVLATTRFPVAPGPHTPNGEVDMPVVWTKYFGSGRVFYCSLGHSVTILRQPEVLQLCIQGFLWAARNGDPQTA